MLFYKSQAGTCDDKRHSGKVRSTDFRSDPALVLSLIDSDHL